MVNFKLFTNWRSHHARKSVYFLIKITLTLNPTTTLTLNITLYYTDSNPKPSNDPEPKPNQTLNTYCAMAWKRMPKLQFQIPIQFTNFSKAH